MATEYEKIATVGHRVLQKKSPKNITMHQFHGPDPFLFVPGSSNSSD